MNTYTATYSVIEWTKDDDGNLVMTKTEPDKTFTYNANYRRSAKNPASKWVSKTIGDARLKDETWFDMKSMSYKSVRIDQTEYVLTVEQNQ